MRPPICAICDKRLSKDDGGLIYFALRQSDIRWKKKAEKGNFIGHPPFVEWFCGKHYPKAEELSDLTIDKAMKKLKETFS